MYIPLTYTVLLCSRLPSSRWYHRVVSQLRCFHNDSFGRNYSCTQQHCSSKHSTHTFDTQAKSAANISTNHHILSLGQHHDPAVSVCHIAVRRLQWGGVE